MNELLTLFLALLKNQQNSSRFEVCSSFDAVPVSSKSRKLFVVVSPESMKLSQPFSGSSGQIAPFTADFRFYVLAPMTTPSEQLLQFFYSVLVPALHDENCFLYEMQADAPKADYKLQKLVYSAVFRIKGLWMPDSQEAETL
ncbi:MAG: hypothetical protein IJ642_01415 [Oscillospiraceae bacterium]|nr:hypothetical protein [Oscillospiraceae bacterium]